jgi:D-methionine transport system substrate-binding protein
MKNRFLAVLLAGATTISLLAGTTVFADDTVTVKLGVMGGSDEQIWDPIVEEFKEKGVDIEYVFFSDYTQPNAALDNGEIDLNAFQTHKYMNQEIETFGYDIIDIGDTLLTSLNLYSTKISDVSELQEGDKIAIPSDAVSFGRGLNVLQAAGLITLKEGVDEPEESDIVENPLNLELVVVDASQTASLLPDVAAAIINGAFSLDAGLSPSKDAIFHDDPAIYNDNSYVNVIAARTEDKDNELYKEIVAAYQTDRTAEIFENEFDGLYVPGWTRDEASEETTTEETDAE